MNASPCQAKLVSKSLSVMRLQDWLVTLLTRAMTHGEVTQSSLDLSNILILEQKMAVRITKEMRRKYTTVLNSAAA